MCFTFGFLFAVAKVADWATVDVIKDRFYGNLPTDEQGEAETSEFYDSLYGDFETQVRMRREDNALRIFPMVSAQDQAPFSGVRTLDYYKSNSFFQNELVEDQDAFKNR